MLNKIIVMGRLTKEPESRQVGETTVCHFTVACERDYKKSDKEKDTDFIDVVAWRNTGEFVQKYFTKGRMALVEGRLQIRDWTDKDGGKRRSAEIVADNVYFGDSKPKGEEQGQQSQGRNQGYSQGYNQNQAYQQPQYSQPYQNQQPPAGFVPDFGHGHR